MKCVTILILVGAAIQIGADSELPKYIVPCEASDEICLKNTLNSLQPHLVQGIKEFQLPSIVPFHIPDFNHSKSMSPDTNFSAIITNAQITQVDNYEVSKINIDLNHLKFLLILNFPQLAFTMHEKVTGRSFGLDTNWDGDGRITFENVTITFSLNGKQKVKEEKQHVHWEKDSIDLSTDLIIYDLQNLVKDKNVAAAFQQKHDENRDLFDDESKLVLKETLANYIFKIINVVHDTFPIDVLYANQ